MELLQQNDLATTLNLSRVFVRRVEEESGVDLKRCYQCGKCSGGCPVAFAMDYTPRQIVRLLQLGFVEEAIRARSPWLCVCCQACYTRCPKEINLPALMETLRIENRRAGLTAPEKDVALFNDLFLASVSGNGRVHEMGLVLKFNLQSGHFFKDAAYAPRLYRSGKLSLAAHKIRAPEAVAKIFARAQGGE